MMFAGKDEPPVAHAGPDQTIQLPADSAVLSGDRSDTLIKSNERESPQEA